MRSSRLTTLAGLLLSLAITTPALAQQTTVKLDAFAVTLDEGNAYLPTSLTWAGPDGGEAVELLHPQIGLNLSFTSFEFRNKIYRSENRHVWGERDEPRFVTDVKDASLAPVLVGGFLQNVTVQYKASYANVTRNISAIGSDRVWITYELTMTRDVVLHESHVLGISLRLADGFTQSTVVDPRGEGDALVIAEAVKTARYSLNVLNDGPMMFVNAERNTAVVVEGVVEGDLPSPVPSKLLQFKEGDILTFTLHLHVGPADGEAMTARLRELAAKQDESSKPYRLVALADLLVHRGELDEAEAVLLEAAQLDRDYAVPFAQLAAIRRDHDRPGQTEAWVEAGYRNGYNYGYMLSGSRLHQQAELTEEQRRQHLFNLLITVENTVFYPDYYIWASRGFEEMQMYAQAAAMYRQGLWAIDHMPRPDDFKQKLRERFQTRLAELEARLLETPTTLPELIPVRVEAAEQ